VAVKVKLGKTAAVVPVVQVVVMLGQLKLVRLFLELVIKGLAADCTKAEHFPALVAGELVQ